MMLPIAKMLFASLNGVAICQTQNYPLRENERGYLGRYVDQPLFVDASLSPACDAGSHIPFASLELSRRMAKDYGFDGFCSFLPATWKNEGWFATSAKSGVKDFISVGVLQRYDPGKPDEERAFAFAATNALSRLPDGRNLVLGYWAQGSAYWTKSGTPPERMRKWMSHYRAAYGTNFVFVTDLPDAGRYRLRNEFATTGDLSPESRDSLRKLFRDTLSVVDGVSVGETHMLQRIDRTTLSRVHMPEYLRVVFGIMREVLDEPGMKGKLMGMVVVNGHENAYTRGYGISHDGTRTLRGILDVARVVRPDVFKFAEWDEYNENTCFCPTLYNGTVTKRIVRSFFQEYRGERLAPVDGDDVTIPNLAISYRKSLSPGEPLAVEVLNVADGTGRGCIRVSVRVTDEKGDTLHSFHPQLVSAEQTGEARFVMPTDSALSARALRVELTWVDASGRRGCVFDGLHAVDFAPRMSWNHKWVKQAIRDIAPMGKSEVAFEDGELKAELECAEPIRHAMVVGGGEILYIHNAEDKVSRFAEDESNAVFQVTYTSQLPSFPASARKYWLALNGVPEAQWLLGTKITRGEKHRVSWLSLSTEPEYLRVPKARLKDAVLEADFMAGDTEIIRGRLPLAAAWEHGAFAIGAKGATQIALARLNRQAVYPRNLNRTVCSFKVRPPADRATMVYMVQVVTMGGKVWRSRPFVAEKGSRSPVLEYDFSPKAGDVVCPKNGERWFMGALGGFFSTATCRNRGPQTSGALEEGGDCAKCRPGDDWRPRQVKGDGGWELVFDGRDDLVGFPWETVPQFGPWEVSFEFKPDDVNRKACLFASAGIAGYANLQGIFLDHGRINVGFRSMRNLADLDSVASAENSVAAGLWHRVTVRHTGSAIELELDGVKTSAKSLLPGWSTSTSLLGGMPRCGYFKGSIRNLRIR